MFSANTQWTVPRQTTLAKSDSCGFGFTIKGEAPSIVVEIEPDSPADVCHTHVLIKPDSKIFAR